ncbi:hypothetical protein FKM82_003253 [Ascaphus truei]
MGCLMLTAVSRMQEQIKRLCRDALYTDAGYCIERRLPPFGNTVHLVLMNLSHCVQNNKCPVGSAFGVGWCPVLLSVLVHLAYS